MDNLSPIRTGPLGPLAAAGEPCPAAELRLLPSVAKLIFRGRLEAIVAAGGAFGVALPNIACRAATRDDRAALWLGPDEWLLLAPEHEEAEIKETLDASLAGLPHALVAVGHRNTGIGISGEQATAVLNSGCPLDLDVEAFPVGMCTRTLLGKAEIVLWRTGHTTFRIEVWRSFAAYVWQFLDEARREFR